MNPLFEIRTGEPMGDILDPFASCTADRKTIAAYLLTMIWEERTKSLVLGAAAGAVVGAVAAVYFLRKSGG